VFALFRRRFVTTTLCDTEHDTRRCGQERAGKQQGSTVHWSIVRRRARFLMWQAQGSGITACPD